MQASAEIIWEAAQQLLRSMLNTDIYNLWFLPIKATMLDEETLTLEVANDFCEVWLKDNYLGLITDVVAQACGQNLKVEFRVNASAHSVIGSAVAEGVAKAKPVPELADRNGSAIREIAFNPKNTFESFVVGENNNHAHAAAMAGGPGARQILQPSLPLRRRRSGQNPFAARHRPACDQQPKKARA